MNHLHPIPEKSCEPFTRENPLVIEVPWTKCPGCKDSLSDAWSMGVPEPNIYYVIDSQVPAGFFTLVGWDCGGLLYGTIIAPVMSHHHTYVKHLPGRTIDDVQKFDFPYVIKRVP